MPLGRLLWISLLVFGAVGAVFVLVPALRQALSRRLVASAVAVSVILSAGSCFISDSDASGTGTRTSHGFPRPYYFTWESWEQPSRHAGINWLYFAGNCFGWLSAVSLALVLWLAARRRLAMSRRR